MKTSPMPLSLLVLALVICFALGAAFAQAPGVPPPGVPAPGAPPAAEPQQPPDAPEQQDPDRLVIDDFEGNVGARWQGGLVAETMVVKQGRQSGRWINANTAGAARKTDIPSDWTGYTFWEFWAWSAAANNAEIVINAYTDNELTDGIDYFQRRITIDWQGWKHFKLPLGSFSVHRQPTMERIDSIGIINHGWGLEPRDDTGLLFDDMVLTRVDEPQLPEGYVADFDGDVSWISGLELVELEGRKCALWDGGSGVSTRPFENWSDYDFIEMDIHSKAANNDRFLIMIESDNPDTEEPDYWSGMINVDWAGWRQFKLPLKRLPPMRKPLGWRTITSFYIYGNGWGMPQKPDTRLSLDYIKLTKKTDDEPIFPPNVIDNFEYGTALWWGDTPVETEHVHGGQRAMRIVPETRQVRMFVDEQGAVVRPDNISVRTRDGETVYEYIDPQGERHRLQRKEGQRVRGYARTTVAPGFDWSGKSIRFWLYVSGTRGNPLRVELGAYNLRSEGAAGVWRSVPGREHTLQKDGATFLEFPLVHEDAPPERAEADTTGYVGISFSTSGAQPEDLVICVDDVEVVPMSEEIQGALEERVQPPPPPRP